jgi:hypothetical protein
VIKSINPLEAIIEANGLWVNALMIKNCAYLEIDGLEVYNSDEQGKSSGITIAEGIDHNFKSHHIIIRGNVAFENECDLPFVPGGFSTPTDGNGIIVDDLYRSQANPEDSYKQDVLIEKQPELQQWRARYQHL